MRRHLLSLLAVVVLAPFAQTLAVPAASAAEPRPATAHPRLLFNASDVPAMRARVSVPGSVHAAAYSRLLASANRFMVEIQPAIGGRRWMRLIAAPVCIENRSVRLHGLKLII